MAPARLSDPAIFKNGDVVVERDPLCRSGRLLRMGEMEASYVDLADASHLEFDYMRWMRIVLREARARRVLHVGGGACTLARALAADGLTTRQEVCEVDSTVLAAARAHLGLRRMPGLRVRNAEGRAFVAAQRKAAWDAVVVDAFIGALVPRHLITVEAMGEIARVAPLALVNVVDGRARRDARLIAAALAEAYPRVWGLGWRAGNTVLVGTRVALDAARVAAAAAADPSPARLLPVGALSRATPPLRDAELQSGGRDTIAVVPFDPQPVLVGDSIQVRPLRWEDFDRLYDVARDPLIWEQHPASDRHRRHVFTQFFAEAMRSGGALVVETRSGSVIGSSRYHGYDKDRSEVEIGWTFLARSHWGGATNGELKRLMLDHAFRFVDRVVFLVGPGNMRSQRALLKIGARESGLATDGSGEERRRFEILRDDWWRRRSG